MKYTILYLEDQTADTMVADFAIKDVELIVNKAKTEKEAVEAMHQQDFDAYLMDYRLSQERVSLTLQLSLRIYEQNTDVRKIVRSPS